MKTAMQELIAYFIDNHGYLTADDFLKKAQSLLEKEKQQISNAFTKGQKDIAQYLLDFEGKTINIDCDGLRKLIACDDDTEDGEQYYNQTYGGAE